MTATPPPARPASRVRDPRRPTAAQWLADGPGARRPDVAILGVPAFGGAVVPSGAHATPAAIRRALASLSTYAVSRRADLADLAAYDRGDVEEPDAGEEGEWRTRIAVSATLDRARLLVALGGVGTITVPVVDGAYGARLADAGLVAVDAQVDLRSGRRSTSSVRRLIELGLCPNRIAVVGVADWADSASYLAEAAELGIRVFSRAQVRERGAAAVMADALDTAARGGGGVAVSVDLAACEPSLAPACYASVPGGLTAHELLEMAYAAGASPGVRVIDVVEVDANADAADRRTVRLAAASVLEAAAGLLSRTEG